ncbi:MAG TPA: DUF4198 domain-containing protein [Gemmatimonadales bacterium]|nr:DUF4198 domain-containing protein [Gemmatimonadales bacterium]
MWKRLAGAILLVMVTATVLLAHDLFLKLDSYFVPPQSSVRVAVLNGTFAMSEGAVTADRLRDLSVVGPIERHALARDAWQPMGDSTWLTVATGATGTYVIGASLLPREITLTAEQFNSYLEEDGIPDVLEARRASGEMNRAARERYQKHVKAILQVGDTRTPAFATALGYPAEIVPLTNPYGLRIGDTLVLRCLVDGQPVAQQLVIAGGEHGGRAMQEVQARTDSDGVARFAIAASGRWYVKFIHMVPVGRDSIDYESKWATLTFELR